jgi:hypothetical protein
MLEQGKNLSEQGALTENWRVQMQGQVRTQKKQIKKGY